MADEGDAAKRKKRTKKVRQRASRPLPASQLIRDLNEVTHYLYIGSVRAVNEDSLQEKGITCVVDCSAYPPGFDTSSRRYIPINIDDNEKAHIAKHFDGITKAIEDERAARGKTLVYCVAGISRSATFCLAYLMRYEEMSLKNAYHHLHSCRRIVYPNFGFFRQLIDYEQELYGKNTVHMVPLSETNDTLVPDIHLQMCKGMVWLKSVRNQFRRSRSKDKDVGLS